MEKINQWALRKLPSRRQTTTITICDAGLLIGDRPRLVTWQFINEIVATRSDELIGNTLLLVVGLADGSVLQIPEHAPCWDELVKAIPQHLTGAKAFEDWALQSAFADDHVVVFRR